MKDYLGQQLAVGDKVVMIAPRYRSLVVGTITAFTDLNVRVDYTNTWNFRAPGRSMKILQSPDQLVKVCVTEEQNQ